MDLKVIHGSIETTPADALIVNLFENIERPIGATGAVDQALSGAIADILRGGDFHGRLNEIAGLYTRGAIPAARGIVIPRIRGRTGTSPAWLSTSSGTRRSIRARTGPTSSAAAPALACGR